MPTIAIQGRLHGGGGGGEYSTIGLAWSVIAPREWRRVTTEWRRVTGSRIGVVGSHKGVQFRNSEN
jgi:hypothetical protein